MSVLELEGNLEGSSPLDIPAAFAWRWTHPVRTHCCLSDAAALELLAGGLEAALRFPAAIWHVVTIFLLTLFLS